MDPVSRLQALPRAGLTTATPVDAAPRFSEEVGREVLLKRDDVGSVALAGNKVRKFDLILGDALDRGADLLITTGAAQSNSARAAAAAAARLGLDCHLFLSGERPSVPTANVLLDELLGARLTYLPTADWSGLEEAVRQEAEAATNRGRTPVAAPVGASSPLGALGFALAYLELADQLPLPLPIVHASSSLGTHAGLLVGRALAGHDAPIIGIDVAEIHSDQHAAAAALAQQAAALIGLGLPEPRPWLVSDYLGPGYGIPGPATAAAIDQLARTEAVITDPVYSGKGLAGLLGLLHSGVIPGDGPVLFWHTGGYHALFDPPHAAALATARGNRAQEMDHRETAAPPAD